MAYSLSQAVFDVKDVPAGLRDYFEPAECGVCYICRMVEVFAEVRRVLRDDGQLWLNMGDSYAAGKLGRADSGSNGRFGGPDIGFTQHRALPGLKPKDLCGIPWRLALALQADGWWLRQDIIWKKPNPMPESVTDRCTKAHEYIFMLTKAARYYWDADAVREGSAKVWNPHKGFGVERKKSIGLSGEQISMQRTQFAHNTHHDNEDKTGRNLRSVWTIPTHAYPNAHFATFPPAIPERCIKAGTSEKGCCPECGAGWVRVVEADSYGSYHDNAPEKRLSQGQRHEKGKKLTGEDYYRKYKSPRTLGWQPGCACGTCQSCGVVIECGHVIHQTDSGTDVQEVRGDVHGRPQTEVLQSGLQTKGGGHLSSVPGMRAETQADQQPTDILQQVVLGQSDREVQEELPGREDNREHGLCNDLETSRTKQAKRAVCNGTSAVDGASLGQASAGVRGSPSQELRQDRQPYGQSGIVAKAGPRSAATPNVSCNLPVLWGGVSGEGECPCCGARFIAPVPESSIILDPFCGSGTTLMVAARLGRKSIGIELNADYAEMARHRIEYDLRPGTFRDDTKPTEDAELFALASSNGGP